MGTRITLAFRWASVLLAVPLFAHCKHVATAQVIQIHPAQKTADDPAARGDTWSVPAPRDEGEHEPEEAIERLAQVKGPPPQAFTLNAGESRSIAFVAEVAGKLRVSLAWRGAGPVVLTLAKPVIAHREDASTPAGGSTVLGADIAAGSSVEMTIANRGGSPAVVHAGAGIYPPSRSSR